MRLRLSNHLLPPQPASLTTDAAQTVSCLTFKGMMSGLEEMLRFNSASGTYVMAQQVPSGPTAADNQPLLQPSSAANDEPSLPATAADSQPLLQPSTAAADQPLLPTTAADNASRLQPGRPTTQFDVLQDVVPPASLWSRMLPVLVVVPLVVLIGLEIAIIPWSIWLSGENAALSTLNRVVYATGMTILATVVSAVTIGQIRLMWLGRLKRGDKGVQEAQLLLQIGNLATQFELIWLTGLLLVLGLITTSVVGSSTVTVAKRSYTATFPSFNGRDPASDTPWQNACWEQTTSPGTQIAWPNTTDNTYLIQTPDWGDSWCPLWITANLFAAPNSYAQIDPGVCQDTECGGIMCSALGAPVDIYAFCDELAAFGYRLGVTNRACVPVFAESPIQCRAIPPPASDLTGAIRSINGTTCSATISTVSLSSPNPPYLFGRDQVVKFCPDENVYGSLTFVIGAAGNTEAALYLNHLLSNRVSRDAVAAECFMTMDATLDYRMITNTTLEEAHTVSRLRRPVVINATGEQCDPQTGNVISLDAAKRSVVAEKIDKLLDTNARMTAASVLWSSFFQGSQTDLVDLLQRAATLKKTETFVETPRIWASSDNKLEDFFGHIVGSSMSYYWGFQKSTLTTPDQPVNHVEYTVWANRIGSGSWVALLYLIPLVCAVVVIVWLWVGELRQVKLVTVDDYHEDG